MKSFHALLARSLIAVATLALPAVYAADMAASAPGPAEAGASQVEAGIVVSPGPVAAAHSAPEPAAASAPHTAAPALAAPPKVVPEADVPRKKTVHTRKRATPPREERQRKPAAAPAEKKATPSVSLDERQNHNPVLDAIELVATTQQAEIQAADKKVAESDWWTDTLERNWIVRRPFGPGIFDSTHWFYVSYKVNGRILMSWFVDLNKGTVSAIAPPEQQSLR